MIFDAEKLAWLNGKYISEVPAGELLNSVRDALRNRGCWQEELDMERRDYSFALIDLWQSRSRTINELADNIAPFASVFTLKQDDPDAHAKAIAEMIGTPEFGKAVSDMARIHIFSISRISRDQVVFQTNFDADVVAYFEAFKDLETPLRAVLSHFEGAPEEGAAFTDLLEFIASCQVEVIAYFCAYPELTVNQIRRDADWRMKVVDLQKSLAHPAENVAVGQTISSL